MGFALPPELVQAAAESKLIPFVGSGLSAGQGVPDWTTLLQNIRRNIERIGTSQEKGSLPDAAAFQEDCASRPEKAAQALSRALKGEEALRSHVTYALAQAEPRPLDSGTHVDLINLGAARIYTTNYDRLLESQLNSLGIEFDSISTTRDLIDRDERRTQVVKLHGDILAPSSIILTGSSYLDRTGSPSQIDSNLRDHALSRSILFLGYSLSDLNIQILVKSIYDIAKENGREAAFCAWVAGFDLDNAGHDLAEDLGVRAIDLGSTEDLDEDVKHSVMTQAVADFLLDLALAVGHTSARPQYTSATLLSRSRKTFELAASSVDQACQADALVPEITRRRLRPHQSDSYLKLARTAPQRAQRYALAAHGVREGLSSEPLIVMVYDLLREGSSHPETVVMLDHISDAGRTGWALLHAVPMPATVMNDVILQFESEIDDHSNGNGADANIVYLFDIAYRVVEGWIRLASDVAETAVNALDELLGRARGLYSTEPDVPLEDPPEGVVRVTLTEQRLLSPFQNYEPEADYGPPARFLSKFARLLDPGSLEITRPA